MPRIAVLFLIFISCISDAGCGRTAESPSPSAEPADTRVRELADAYVDGFLDQFPEQATYYGVPGRRHDRLSDNSLSALAAWQAREHHWLAEARAIDTAAIQSASLRATYAILREALESSTTSRVCRNELWNVSQMTGWHVNFGYLVTIQPVGSDVARKEALARWGSLPKYVDGEIANLREGIKGGYTAPKHIVRIVIDQVRTLAAGGPADSPFATPGARDRRRSSGRRSMRSRFSRSCRPRGDMPTSSSASTCRSPVTRLRWRPTPVAPHVTRRASAPTVRL